MNSFFDLYPDILDKCIKINQIIKLKYGFDNDVKEISFDQTIPFLFESDNQGFRFKLAVELRIYREIVNFYNQGINYKVSESLRKIISIPIIKFDDYININDTFRKLQSNNIFDSYLISTKRVFYRFLLLYHYRNIFRSKDFYFIYYSVKHFSAFLLFDDDIFDFEYDIMNKDTILTEFLNNNKYNIQSAIKSILNSICMQHFSANHLFTLYSNQFISIYYE